MKKILFIIFLLSSFQLNAQIAKIESDQSQFETQVTDIVVVFIMHVDIGYTNWAEGVLQDYAGSMLEKTLQSIEKTSTLPKEEQFIWTIPSWPLHYMLENCSPSLKLRLEKAIRDGRIIPHALPTTFETEASDLESLTRGFQFASSINRKYNLPVPREAKLTDVPSHSWVLPTLLKHAGVDILHIGCNPGSTSPKVPTLFWWQGVDGSKLLTFNWAEYYGSGILPPKGWKHKTWLAMIHTHENTGAPDPAEVEKILQEAKEKIPNARIKIGRLSDFYDLLMKENPDLPVVRGDMPDSWIHGYLSSPRELQLSKRLQRYTYNTEILNTLIGNWIKPNFIDNYVDKTVENMILYDEHTFGIAMTHGNQQFWTYNDEFKMNKSRSYYDFAESSWKEKANRINNAERIITPIMRKQLKNLASSVNIDGKKVVVFNPLPWKRDGRVEFFLGVYMKNFNIYALKDLESGEIIPAHNEYNLLSFDAKQIPALGYKTYLAITEPVNIKTNNLMVDSTTNQLENEFFKIIIDPVTGSLLSTYDKKNKKELVNKNKSEGFAQYIYEQFGQKDLDRYNKSYVKPGSEGWANQEMGRPSVPLTEGKVYTGKCSKIVYKKNSNSISASVFGYLDDPEQQKYIVNYTLYENQPYIEIKWGVDGKKPNAIPEAGWLSFDFAMDAPEYRLYRTGGIVDPNKDFVENTNQDYYFLNTSMCMFDKNGKGVTINCPTSPGVSIDSMGLYHFSGKKHLSQPKVFVNLYNTQWGTNFTEWIEGSFTSFCFIWSFEKYDTEKNFITPSEETREPLYAVLSENNEGNLPTSQEGISLSRKGILVTAYGNNRDGDGKILRLWEQTGKEEKCIITFPKDCNYKIAYPCNLRGEQIKNKEIKIQNSSFEIMMKANQPASFILK